MARRHGVCGNTIYRWNAKYGGMAVSEAKGLRELEQENVRLKRLLAEAELDKSALKKLVRGKWWRPRGGGPRSISGVAA